MATPFKTGFWLAMGAIAAFVVFDVLAFFVLLAVLLATGSTLQSYSIN